MLLKVYLLFVSFASSILIYASTGTVPIERYLSRDFQPIIPCGLPFVDACFVINLDHRTDRWAYMQEISAREGVAFTRVPAVYGPTLPSNIGSVLGEWDEYRRQRVMGIGPHALGCMLSHLSVLYRAEQSSLGRIWVFEDDIVLHTTLSDVQYLVDAIEAELGSDSWDIIYTDRRTKQVSTSKACFEPVKLRCGTYSMLVSTTGRRKLLDHYRKYGIFRAIDRDLGLIPGMRFFQPAHQNLVTFTRQFGSDTQIRWPRQRQAPPRRGVTNAR